MKDKKKRNIIVVLAIIISIYTIGIVNKDFQNDTFFNISIGKYILEHGIDMKEHFAFTDDLSYTYSHWAFDLICYKVYEWFGFPGLYGMTIIIAIIINASVFIFSSKRCKNPIASFFVTIIVITSIKEAYTARSQIISFICFIAEIYCIEEFIETRKTKYGIYICICSVIVANFHAASWPLVLVLMLPYLASAFLNLISRKNIYQMCANYAKKKLDRKDLSDKKKKKYEEDYNDYTRFANDIRPPRFSRIKSKKSYFGIGLVVLFIIVSITGLITPIKDVPYTYVIKSMIGKTNFENGEKSIEFISEMSALIPAASIPFIVFTVLFIAIFGFLPVEIKKEHGFLLAGLFMMALVSVRYMFILGFLSIYVLADMLSQAFDMFINDDIEKLQNILLKRVVVLFLIIVTFSYSFSNFQKRFKVNYVNEKKYPVGAVEYIKKNTDYKNIRIYNGYDYGSYLMLNDIPVFIDSRLDVYCSEFNDTDIFRDFIYVQYGKRNYKEIFTKYNFSHVLLQNDSIVNQYVSSDFDYKIIYQDDSFSLYERRI